MKDLSLEGKVTGEKVSKKWENLKKRYKVIFYLDLYSLLPRSVSCLHHLHLTLNPLHVSILLYPSLSLCVCLCVCVVAIVGTKTTKDWVRHRQRGKDSWQLAIL